MKICCLKLAFAVIATTAVVFTAKTKEIIPQKPTIFLLGVQKGGTNSLFQFLMLHKDICAPYSTYDSLIKEPHFFDQGTLYGNSDSKNGLHYLSHFHDKKCENNPMGLYIDSTPMFHSMAAVAPRLNAFYSAEEKNKLKFIVLLREPVGRDLSWFEHVTRNNLALGMKFSDINTYDEIDDVLNPGKKPWRCGSECKCVQSNCKHTNGRYVKRSGFYQEYLMDLAKYFNRSQILVMNSATLFQDSFGSMKIISSFLGIDPIEEWRNKPFPHDDHLSETQFDGILDCVLQHVPPLDCDFLEQMGQYYVPMNDRLVKWIASTKKIEGDQPSMEPPFIPFGDSYKSIKCIPHARNTFNETVLAKSTKQSCLD